MRIAGLFVCPQKSEMYFRFSEGKQKPLPPKAGAGFVFAGASAVEDHAPGVILA
jgi:hypothetical protein